MSGHDRIGLLLTPLLLTTAQRQLRTSILVRASRPGRARGRLALLPSHHTCEKCFNGLCRYLSGCVLLTVRRYPYAPIYLLF